MAEKPVTKEQVLFYLKRHASGLVYEAPSMEKLAKMGVPYDQRAKKLKEWEEQQEKAYQERCCYEKAIELVEKYG